MRGRPWPASFCPTIQGRSASALYAEKGMHFNPSPEDGIEAGDYLIAMGEPSQLRQLEQMAAGKI